MKKHTLHLNLACKKKKRKSQYRKSSEGKNHQYKSTRRLGVLLLLTCLCTQSPCCVNLYAIKKYYNGSINGLNWFEPWVRTGSNHGFERFRTKDSSHVSDLDQRVRTGSNLIRTHGSKWFQWQNRVEIGFEPLEKWVRTVFEPMEPRVRTGSNLGSDDCLCYYIYILLATPALRRHGTRNHRQALGA